MAKKPTKPIGTDSLMGELRKQAEDQQHIINNQKNDKNDLPQTEWEIRRLYNELQVHQIELEIQNNELIGARSKAEALLEGYTDLYDFAPAGYITLTKDGTIRQANLRAASLLGVERSLLNGRKLSLYITNADRYIFNTFLEKVFKFFSNETCEVTLCKGDNPSLLPPSLLLTNYFFSETPPVVISFQATVAENGETCRAVLIDITEQKRANARIRIESDLLQICHQATNPLNLFHELVPFFKHLVDCDAVGVRLHHDDDFPYYITQGFSDDFVEVEGPLCARDSNDDILRDPLGNPIPECICGDILCGRFDPSRPYFTEHGSFWVNNFSRFLAGTTDTDRKSHLRNRCKYEGYESVALVPLRLQGKTYGLFQFNSRRKDHFTLERIELLEQLVNYATLALSSLETRQALSESEERYHTLFDQAASGVALIETKSGRFIDINRIFCDFLGYTKKEILDLSFQDVTHPDDVQMNIDTNKMPLPEDTRELSIEKRFCRKDGDVVWGNLTISPLWFPNNVPVAFYQIVVVQDITERVQIKETLMFLAQRGWEASGENFFTALAHFLAQESKMDYVCVDRLEGEGSIAQTVAIYYDGRFEDNVSYSLKDTPCGDVVGKSVCCFPSQVRHLFPKDTVLQEMVAESYIGITLWSSSGKPIGLIALIGRRHLFDPKPVETILNLVAARAASELEREQKEKELIKEKNLLSKKVEERTLDLRLANAGLLRAAQVKDEFLASMSHELRTPLTAILGLSEALQSKIYGELNPKQFTSIENIEKSGKHLLALINDILDLSKASAGKIELDLETLSVRSVCESCFQFIKQDSHNKQINVYLDIENAPDYFQADRRRIKQILVNLLANAVKFSSNGSAIGLEVKRDIDNQRILFTVWDQGIGISSENLNRLFQPFTQIDSALSRQYSGTGLGLSLVMKMTELHGGGISVESEPGKGSRFTVALPWLNKEPTETNKILLETKYLPKVHPRVINPLILIVEDSPLYLSLLKDILTNSGYRVVTATNGEEGIVQARENKPDLILMDVQMPVLDGFQATQRIRAYPGMDKIPIIALTALAMSGDRERCFNAGMNDYLSKPVNIDALEKIIAELI